mmetsp:Transcript_26619/g.92519  ORF Transcript_26619/g.92519 Transcript_26619/m.92519 type:complete len:348 (-) Transcript_26619:726-1769(-)
MSAARRGLSHDRRACACSARSSSRVCDAAPLRRDADSQMGGRNEARREARPPSRFKPSTAKPRDRQACTMVPRCAGRTAPLSTSSVHDIGCGTMHTVSVSAAEPLVARSSARPAAAAAASNAAGRSFGRRPPNQNASSRVAPSVVREHRKRLCAASFAKSARSDLGSVNRARSGSVGPAAESHCWTAKAPRSASTSTARSTWASSSAAFAASRDAALPCAWRRFGTYESGSCTPAAVHVASVTYARRIPTRSRPSSSARCSVAVSTSTRLRASRPTTHTVVCTSGRTGRLHKSPAGSPATSAASDSALGIAMYSDGGRLDSDASASDDSTRTIDHTTLSESALAGCT